jgi:hypothetical protein
MENKNFDLILLQSNNLLEDLRLYNSKNKFTNIPFDELKILMHKKYEYLHDNCLTIFTQCMENNMDISILEFMINQIKNIEKNKISKHDASIKVGEKLVEKYVKPMINKNTDK